MICMTMFMRVQKWSKTTIFWISWDGVYWVKYDKMAASEELIFS